MADNILYLTKLDGVDWERLRETLIEDSFHNGRSAEQLRDSFRNSYAAVLACMDGEVVGTARVLSDGVCNAYVVDVWTHTRCRRRGIGRTMLEVLMARLEGQHVYLFTDEAVPFYKAIGFRERPVGMERTVGSWLEPGR
jgi:ribosomal protein S18 acetylase RimI-like enzyme